MAQQLKNITKRSDDFSQWYTDVVRNSGLVEYGPAKGTMIIKPYGFAIWELLQERFNKEFKKLDVENVYFPLLIPASLFNKEKEHIEGFAPEVFTVTKIGNKILEEELYIRPTSEVLLATHFSKEVKSYRDLPLIYNQWVNVLRGEKTTRPFLRTSEFLWQEGHTLHESEQEAVKITNEILGVYQKVAKELFLLPVIAGEKTAHERFAGASKTMTIESLMSDGHALQCATSHYLGDKFSSAFDIKFQGRDSQWHLGYSTSWGISTRIIGAIIMTHSDDNGLVLPSGIAPIQVQIIEVKETENVTNASQLMLKNLKSKFRVKVDNSDKSFGFKMSEAEIKGIPIRIEVGPRDLENNNVVISRRDNREKVIVPIEDVEKTIIKMMSEYDKNIYNLALENTKNRTWKAETIEEYIAILSKEQGFVLVPFCGEISCEADVKEKTQTTSRCIPNDVKQVKGKCFNCGKDSQLRVYFARSY
ncbi:prolyl-tRNA synthetase [Spiroplasma sabaudiense Ar-1343]|uniref:Proline--tRNA ligase n=1 Tax=Spiroplasma sabaudiense Ar-1343 TaxID=1276257 RepID=W6A990_9MOLU|nr:proline--tRNA ligase [Spiroplasma sabaudiense]AHI53546.1 prolyl-tRNA synthetase [Spiroplasma sabaudiense Ar-1343]